MTMTHYATLSEARSHFKDLFDAAAAGRPATVQRDSRRAALVDAERLRVALLERTPSRAQVVPEAGGWSVFIPGLPVAADGSSFEEAIAEMVGALREYAEDWSDHLLHAPNHDGHWGLVQLIELSSDEQLAAWLVG